MGLSIRAYARHRGVSHVAVKKAIDSGRITPLPDGTLDPERADAEWSRNTTATHANGHVKAVRAAAAHQAASSAEGSDAPVALPSGGASLLQARTLNEVLKAQIRKIDLAEKKGEVVNRAQAVAHVYKLARAERDAWLNWPNRVAAKLAALLGADEHLTHAALESAVREHLEELGEFVPKVDG